MATQDFIVKRIEGKKKEIDKLEKKLARILKAKESGWQNNPYYYHEKDIDYTTRDIESAKEALAKYEQELIDENNKAASRNVPAITEFLDRWEKRMTEYFREGLQEAYSLHDELNKLYERYDKCGYGTPEWKATKEEYEQKRAEFNEAMHGTYEEIGRDRYGIRRQKVKDGKLEYVREYYSYGHDLESSMARVAKVLKTERDDKYDFILERTISITGKITDASMLRVGATGELNGNIIGEKGIANVKTIGAGGYNIQCFHFRTLIHRSR